MLQLAYVRVLAENASNTIFALARDLADAPELIEFAAKAPHKNVHTGKLDLLDVQSIKVRRPNPLRLSLRQLTS